LRACLSALPPAAALPAAAAALRAAFARLAYPASAGRGRVDASSAPGTRPAAAARGVRGRGRVGPGRRDRAARQKQK
jgi:hypothetical protein